MTNTIASQVASAPLMLTAGTSSTRKPRKPRTFDLDGTTRALSKAEDRAVRAWHFRETGDKLGKGRTPTVQIIDWIDAGMPMVTPERELVAEVDGYRLDSKGRKNGKLVRLPVYRDQMPGGRGRPQTKAYIDALRDAGTPVYPVAIHTANAHHIARYNHDKQRFEYEWTSKADSKAAIGAITGHYVHGA